MTGEDYLRQQLEWVVRRIEALDEIEVRLKKMRALAVYARDNNLNRVQVQEVKGSQRKTARVAKESNPVGRVE